MTGGVEPRPYTRLPMMCPFYVRGDAPQGYLLRCVGIAPTYRLPKAYAYPSGGSFHLIACSSPSNTGALKNSPSVMSSPSQSILMVSSLGF